MTICTNHLTFRKLSFDLLPFLPSDDGTDIKEFAKLHMVELQYQRVSFSTVNARLPCKVVAQSDEVRADYPSVVCLRFSYVRVFILRIMSSVIIRPT
jgi:hypothetical protein